jgi:hypothetical protein
MTTMARTIGVSVSISAFVGIAVGLWFISLGQQGGRESASALQLLAAAALLSGPLSVPLGLVGGLVASVLLKRQMSRVSLMVWIIRGMGVGGILGSLCSPAVPFLLGRGSASLGVRTMAAMFSLAGAACGVLAGALVAVWCYRVQQGRPNNRGEA